MIPLGPGGGAPPPPQEKTAFYAEHAIEVVRPRSAIDMKARTDRCRGFAARLHYDNLSLATAPNRFTCRCPVAFYRISLSAHALDDIRALIGAAKNEARGVDWRELHRSSRSRRPLRARNLEVHVCRAGGHSAQPCWSSTTSSDSFVRS